eukprot:6477676-Amphidinium_carterae.1
MARNDCSKNSLPRSKWKAGRRPRPPPTEKGESNRAGEDGQKKLVDPCRKAGRRQRGRRRWRQARRRAMKQWLHHAQGHEEH